VSGGAGGGGFRHATVRRGARVSPGYRFWVLLLRLVGWRLETVSER